MSEIGKRIRMDRIMDRNTQRTVIIPLDHGVSLGPVTGLQDMKLVTITKQVTTTFVLDTKLVKELLEIVTILMY